MHRLDFQSLFQALPGPHMVLDRNFDYVAANPAYERVTMRTAAELVGRNMFELFPNSGEGGRRLRASFQRVFETGEPDTLAYIPYDIPRPEALGGGMEQRFWTAAHMPLRAPDGEVIYLLQNTTDVTEIVRLREAVSLPYRAGEAELLERAKEAEHQHKTLLDESDDFRRLFQLAPGFFAVLSGPSHVFTFANDAYIRLVGGRSVIGKPVREALPEIESQGFLGMLDHVYRTGERRGGEATRVMLQQSEGELPRETFLDFSYDAIRDVDGAISGIFVQGMDRTESVRAMQRQKLLMDELNHRVKNTLASVQSIAAQTMRSARSVDDAKTAFEARISALSKAHNLLSERQWESADLGRIVNQELTAFGPQRARVEGPRVVLNPKAAIAIAMVIHELSTNAAKYGALSETGGTLSICWRLQGAGDDERLLLDWTEQGGPAVEKPARSGFGSRMIERVTRGELGGKCEFHFRPEGFACQITIPSDVYSRSQHAFA
jgi:PAS domain S-box-containing protein